MLRGLGKLVVHVACFGLELLDGGEHHAAGSHLQQLFQVLAVFRLHWLLAAAIVCRRGKGVEQLVVQVVAVGDHHTVGLSSASTILPV
jgi:hypothetical protein